MTDVASSSMAVPADHIVTVYCQKPQRGTWSFSGRRFLGVSFSQKPADNVDCTIAATFVSLPSAGCLFAGDRVKAVEDKPVARPSDLVFYWDGVAAGPVAIDVIRRETHRFMLSAAALRLFELQWDLNVCAPVIVATSATPDRLVRLQQPGFLQRGDLIIAVGCKPTGRRQEAAEALRLAAEAGQAIEISVIRGVAPPIDGRQESACCSCWPCSKVVAVPRPRRNGGRSAARGKRHRVLADVWSRQAGRAATAGGTLGAGLAELGPPLVTAGDANEDELVYIDV